MTDRSLILFVNYYADEFKYGVVGEWFFFTTRLAGNLPTRNGYWSPSGTSTKIYLNDKIIGFKDTLEFYWGCRPNGTKSKWIIFEYRLNSDKLDAALIDELIKAKVILACHSKFFFF